MRHRRILALLLLPGSACGTPGDSTRPGPYDDIPISATIEAQGLTAPVDLVRDRYGVPHIHAQSVEDAAFVNGYIEAADRILEMNLLRHFATATIAELFGALDQSQIDTDLEMRMHRMRALAEETWMELSTSTDAIDQEIARTLERYADGVNQWVEEAAAGAHAIDDAVSVFFDPTRWRPWTPVDSLAIARLQAWLLSWSDSDLQMTEQYDLARERFDRADPGLFPEHARRAGLYGDLFPIRPMDLTATIDGWPNVSTDSGTRAKPSPAARRPRVPPELLSAARRTLAPKTAFARRLRHPENGSNNWVVGPSLAGGRTLLANDPHLQLSNPSVFYLLHITVAGVIDVQGAAFPGIPGIVLGHNTNIAWGATTVNHDVMDFYLETIAPCSTGGGDCVTFGGNEVPLQSWTETIRVGALGTITRELTVTYERVPHHGVIIPTIENHTLAPRTGSQAISVRYTGHEATHELRAVYELARSRSVAEAFDAMDDFGFGAQNWVIIDDAGDIGWTTTSHVPWRSAACFTFHEIDRPDGLAPYLVLPGDGTCEWEGWMDSRYVPHAVSPAKGYIATANADPVGETFDGDALNGPLVDGRPLYVSIDYDRGYRIGRITRRIEALIEAGAPITLDDLASIQGDTYSNYGAAMRDFVVQAATRLAEERAAPGTHADLAAWAATLGVDEADAIAYAASRLAAWSFETPAAVDGDATADEVVDSVATSIFNAWAVWFLWRAFDDEARVIGAGSALPTTGLFVFARPDELRTGLDPDTGEALLCDDLETAEIESCSLIAAIALADAVAWGESAEGFGTPDIDAWRWGDKHRLTLESMVPAADLDVPNDLDPPELQGGFPRPGDNFSVDASSPGFGDTDFTYRHGPSIRHLVEFTGPATPRARIALPGGQVFDRSSPHFRDLVDTYWRHNQYFDLPWTIPDIVAQAEARLRFH